MRRPLHLLLAALLGVLAAVLVSCGSSGAGLIPAENAGPLLADFQAVERAAKAGNGSCSATEAAILATERDFQRLPAGIDAGLHGKLQEGVSKLRELALETCALPASQTTTGETASTAKTAVPPTTTTTETQTNPTSTIETAPTGTAPGTTQPSGTEGGTAPGVGSGEGQAEEGGAGDNGQGPGKGPGEGAKHGGGAHGDSGSGGTGIGEGSGVGGEQ
ncbi:MAG: hypothetical protein ACRDLF_06295 [Solirubrobacteraceae bacterium]